MIDIFTFIMLTIFFACLVLRLEYRIFSLLYFLKYFSAAKVNQMPKMFKALVLKMCYTCFLMIFVVYLCCVISCIVLFVE